RRLLLTPGFSSLPGPLFFVDLLRPRNGQRVFRDILLNGGARSNVGAAVNRDGCDQLRITPDEYVILDDCLVLTHTVIVAGDRACSDVHVLADLCIAQVAQMCCLCLVAEPRVFDLDKVSNAGLASNDGVIPQMSKWTYLTSRSDMAF